MAKNTTISVLSMALPHLEAPIGDYAAYEKQTKNFLKEQIDKVLPSEPDLIVLPENCIRFNSEYADDDTYWKDMQAYYRYHGSRIEEYLGDIAKNNNTNIAYSQVRFVSDEEKFPFRNSTTYIGRDGKIVGRYDKNHLTISENDHDEIAYGTEAKLIELDVGSVASAICFDLNFNELMEKYKAQHPDLIVFCSAYHGGIKQQIWAYECQSYFVGAIRNGWYDPGHGRILNPFGETIATSTNYTDHVSATVNLDYRLCHIDYNMAKIIAAKNKYKTALEVYDPGYVGCVMLTYNGTDCTVEDIIDEFGIERMDDYFARARKHRQEHM